MDDLLSRVDAHLNSRGLEGFSNNGAKSLIHIVEILLGHEKKSPVVRTAIAQIRKDIRPLHQRPAPALVKATKNLECKVNQDVLELLARCKVNPSAIFESQGPSIPVGAVQNLKELHQLGTHLLSKADEFRRHVFCIIISDAHNIVNHSKWSKTQTLTKTKRAIDRLAACFQADGVDVPLSQLQENLREWVTCGASHQQVMHSLGDGYLAAIPSGIPIGILLKKNIQKEPSIKHLETWGVRRVAEESGANDTIKAIRQFYEEFFRYHQPQANNESPQSATSSHDIGKSSHINAPHAHSTVAAQKVPQTSASDDLSSLERKRPLQCADKDITADMILPEDRESQSCQKRAKTDQTRMIAQFNIHGWESQALPIGQAKEFSTYFTHPNPPPTTGNSTLPIEQLGEFSSPIKQLGEFSSLFTHPNPPPTTGNSTLPVEQLEEFSMYFTHPNPPPTTGNSTLPIEQLREFSSFFTHPNPPPTTGNSTLPIERAHEFVQTEESPILYTSNSYAGVPEFSKSIFLQRSGHGYCF